MTRLIMFQPNVKTDNEDIYDKHIEKHHDDTHTNLLHVHLFYSFIFIYKPLRGTTCTTQKKNNPFFLWISKLC